MRKRTSISGRPAVTVLLGLAVAAFGFAARSEERVKSGIDYSRLESPVAYTDASIERGRMLCRRHCTDCHGLDGRSLIDVVANATDLTAPDRWRYGTSPGEVFRSIREGAGIDMPPGAGTVLQP